MRLQTSVNCTSTFLIVASVLDSQVVVSAGGSVSVQSTTSSFNSTRLELYRTKLAPLKLARILILVIALLNIVQKASKKVLFLTCVIAYFA